jgi:hypothetical protein
MLLEIELCDIFYFFIINYQLVNSELFKLT